MPPPQPPELLKTGVSGAGKFRGAWQGCQKFGHPLVPDPRFPGKPYRRCDVCAQRRSAEQLAAITAARTLLGLSKLKYTQKFGGSKRVALEIVSNLRALT